MSWVAEYIVVAYLNGRAVCEIGTLGAAGLPAHATTGFAQDLREEFPDAIVAITPRCSYISTIQL